MDQDALPTCRQVISNEGQALRTKATLREAWCGLVATSYCYICELYLCSLHYQTNHSFDHEPA